MVTPTNTIDDQIKALMAKLAAVEADFKANPGSQSDLNEIMMLMQQLETLSEEEKIEAISQQLQNLAADAKKNPENKAADDAQIQMLQEQLMQIIDAQHSSSNQTNPSLISLQNQKC